MNGQKIVSALSILAAVGFGPVFAFALNADESRAALPSVSAVLPKVGADVPPPSIELPAVVHASPVTIVASAPRAKAKHWTCGAPRALANDAVQTVRPCEWQ